jgi:hypothetical protein
MNPALCPCKYPCKYHGKYHGKIPVPASAREHTGAAPPADFNSGSDVSNRVLNP